jgi:hypothetical protein
MSKQSLSSSDGQANHVTGWQLVGMRAIYLLITTMLILFIWLYTSRLFPGASASAWWVVGVGMIFTALAVACERLLGSFRLRLDWRYRLAFLIPIGIGLGVWLSSIGLRSGLMNWFWLLVAISGIFLAPDCYQPQ